MPLSNAERLVNLGVVPPLAKELAAQMESGEANVQRLIGNSMVPGLAAEVVAQIASGETSVARLGEMGMVPGVAKEVVAQIQSGGVILPYRFSVSGLTYPNAFSASLKYFNGRKGFVVVGGNLVEPIVELPNFYTSANASEAGSGQPATFTAGLEYNGVTYPITFGGMNAGVAPNKGRVKSDPILGLTIPDGASGFLRVFGDVPGGLMYRSPGGPENLQGPGESLEFASSVLTDKSKGTGPITNTGGTFVFPAVAICSRREKGVASFGDSINLGTNCPGDATYNIGVVARGCGTFIGHCNFGSASQSLSGFLGQDHTNQIELTNLYASHCVIQLGANDGASVSVATRKAAVVGIKALLRSDMNLVGCTVTPRTKGSFTSGSSQTTDSQTIADNVTRIAWNDAIRAGLDGVYPTYMEMADVFETNGDGMSTVRNGNKWKNPAPSATPLVTEDGLHAATYGNTLPALASDSFKVSFGVS